MLHYLCNESPLQAAPYMMEYTDSSGVVKYKGFVIDLLDRVAKMANFEYPMYAVPDNRYGAKINRDTLGRDDG